MEWYGREITTMLRHHYCDQKCPDGATFEAEKLARICSERFQWPVSVRTLWQLAQEGQGNTKARVMILVATDEAGSVVGWDTSVLGQEPKHNECAELSYRDFYYLEDRKSPMTVLGFKCVQGMSGTGGDIELYRHIPSWWNNEVAGKDFSRIHVPRNPI